jgi:hypothetical protein
MGWNFKDEIIKKQSADEDHAGKDVVLSGNSGSMILCLTQGINTIDLDPGQIEDIHERLIAVGWLEK